MRWKVCEVEIDVRFKASGDAMHELFRLRIAAKRQMTAPQRLLDALSLSEGDEIQVEVSDGRIVGVHPCKAVPTSMLSADLLAEIRQQEQRLAEGKGLTLPQAMREIENKKREDREKRAAGKRGKVEFGTGVTEKLHG